MQPVISLCGMRCDLCMAYQPNIAAHPENRQILSDGWYTYFGFRIPSEQIECNGCFPNGEMTLDSTCQVRPCVTERQLDNCASCEAYICEKLDQILVSFDEMQAKFDTPFPEQDRQNFIFPYENKDRLAALRKAK